MIFLGSFLSVSEAIREATSFYMKVEKCPFCLRNHSTKHSFISVLKDTQALFVSALPDHDDFDFMICCTN
ncbi:MAG: hypothetical protein GYA71_03315 [Bacteroidales bacterium]|nr:hypothetical protein [Bacteroidales bacterium]